jgi:hypothetical protein
MEYVELRIFAETTIFYAGLFLKNILYFAKRILSKRSRKFFNNRTKPLDSTIQVSQQFPTGFHFQKQLLDFPSTIAHGSTAEPFKNHFSQSHSFFGKQNINCHTIPDSSIPVDTDYSNRFELCVEVYTLPTSPALRSHS